MKIEEIIKGLQGSLLSRRNALVYQCATGMEVAIRSMAKVHAITFLIITLEIGFVEAERIYNSVIAGLNFTDAYNKVMTTVYRGGKQS